MNSIGTEKNKNYGAAPNSKKKSIERQPRADRSIVNIYNVSQYVMHLIYKCYPKPVLLFPGTIVSFER